MVDSVHQSWYSLHEGRPQDIEVGNAWDHKWADRTLSPKPLSLGWTAFYRSLVREEQEKITSALEAVTYQLGQRAETKEEKEGSRFLECVGISTTRHLWEMQILRPLPTPTKSETLVWGPAACFNKASGRPWCRLKFGSRWAKRWERGF